MHDGWKVDLAPAVGERAMGLPSRLAQRVWSAALRETNWVEVLHNTANTVRDAAHQYWRAADDGSG